MLAARLESFTVSSTRPIPRASASIRFASTAWRMAWPYPTAGRILRGATASDPAARHLRTARSGRYSRRCGYRPPSQFPCPPPANPPFRPAMTVLRISAPGAYSIRLPGTSAGPSCRLNALRSLPAENARSPAPRWCDPNLGRRCLPRGRPAALPRHLLLDVFSSFPVGQIMIFPTPSASETRSPVPRRLPLTVDQPARRFDFHVGGSVQSRCLRSRSDPNRWRQAVESVRLMPNPSGLRLRRGACLH